MIDWSAVCLVDGAVASCFDKLSMKLFGLGAMKNLSHADLVEARTTVVQPTFWAESPS